MRACIDCGCDISERGKPAKLCYVCANKRNIERSRQRRARLSAAKVRRCVDCGCDTNHLPHMTKRCPECAALRKKIKQKEWKDRQKKPAAKRKDRPGQPIRAITPLSTELGQLCDGLQKRQKKRKVLPPPDLSSARWVVKIGKTTYFPKTEKRYKQLIKQRDETN